MNQKGAGPIVPILVIALLAIGVFVFMGKKDTGKMVKDTPTPAPQGIAVGEPNPAQPKSAETPDAVVDAILSDLASEANTADASADADAIQADTEAINSYGNVYDATSF
jgi:hypothetical protein